MDYKKKYEEAERLYRTANADQRYVLESLFPKLRESDDERIRKDIIVLIKDWWDRVNKDNISTKEQMLAWLEKQGEQEVNEPDWCHHKVDLSDCSEEYRKAYYDGWNNCNQQHSQCNAEQKPADKVEAKFKVEEGKWYVCISQFCNCIEGRVYKATSDSRIMDDFGTEYDMHSDAYKYFRLWTIQDAKDGDVLSDGTTIFIFKDLLSDGSVMSYCDYDTDSGESDAFCPLSVNLICSKITPATKEQRDLLLQKMKEAGYEWDAEKKELRKISQRMVSAEVKEAMYDKLAWSEEDEHRVKDTIYFLDTAKKHYASTVELDACINWLKSLKQRVQPKQKLNEHDNYVIDKVLDWATFVNPTSSIFEKLPKKQFIESLKSLKQRIGG